MACLVGAWGGVGLSEGGFEKENGGGADGEVNCTASEGGRLDRWSCCLKWDDCGAER